MAKTLIRLYGMFNFIINFFTFPYLGFYSCVRFDMFSCNQDAWSAVAPCQCMGTFSVCTSQICPVGLLAIIKRILIKQSRFYSFLHAKSPVFLYSRATAIAMPLFPCAIPARGPGLTRTQPSDSRKQGNRTLFQHLHQLSGSL